ncbi:MAG: hypothetical protein WEF28_06000 [Acidimicrobiia bacterium]
MLLALAVPEVVDLERGIFGTRAGHEQARFGEQLRIAHQGLESTGAEEDDSALVEEGLADQPHDRQVAVWELVECDCVADLYLHRLGEGRGDGHLILGVGEVASNVDQESLCCGCSHVEIPDLGVWATCILQPDPGLAKLGDRRLGRQLAEIRLDPFVDVSCRRVHLEPGVGTPEIGLRLLFRGEGGSPDDAGHDHTERHGNRDEEDKEDRPFPVPPGVLHRHLVGSAASTHDWPLIGCRRS